MEKVGEKKLTYKEYLIVDPMGRPIEVYAHGPQGFLPQECAAWCDKRARENKPDVICSNLYPEISFTTKQVFGY